jgi:hypothetical protein
MRSVISHARLIAASSSSSLTARRRSTSRAGHRLDPRRGERLVAEYDT